MSEGPAAEGTRSEPARAEPAPAYALPGWLRTTTLWVGGALAIVVVAALGVAVLPGWWASLVGSWVLGISSRGIWLGLGVGALFTLLPIAVAVLAARSGLGRARAALVAIAILLLLPNVLTLAVSLARSDAHWVLVIEAPGFGGATIAGVVLVLVAVAATALVRRWTRQRSRALEAAHQRAVTLTRERAAAEGLETPTTPTAQRPATADPGPPTATPADPSE